MNIVEPTSTNLEAHRFRGRAVVFPLLHVHDDGESRVHSRRERPPRHVVALEVLRRCLCQTKQRCAFRQDDFRYDRGREVLLFMCCQKLADYFAQKNQNKQTVDGERVAVLHVPVSPLLHLLFIHPDLECVVC